MELSFGLYTNKKIRLFFKSKLKKMGKCWSKSKSNFFKKRKKIKLMIIGLNKAGKTTIVKYLLKELTGSNDNILPTNGFNCVNLKKYKNFDIQLYDLGGADTIRKIWNNYYGLVHGIIYVIDSIDIDRMDQVKQCLNETISNSKVSGKPVLIFANKQDLDGALDEMEIYKDLNLKDLINKYQCPTKMEACSLVNKWGNKIKSSMIIDESYYWLLNHIIKNWASFQNRVEKETAEQIKSEKDLMEQRIQKYRNKQDLERKSANFAKQVSNKILSKSLTCEKSEDLVQSRVSLNSDLGLSEVEVVDEDKFEKILENNTFSNEESQNLLEKIRNSIQVEDEQNQIQKRSHLKNGQISSNLKTSKFLKIKSKSLKNLLLKQNKITPLSCYTYSRPKSK